MAHRRDLILFGLAAVALLPISGHAERERDHDRARRAVERGEVLPLADILARVRSGTLRGAADLTCDAMIKRESNHDRFSAHTRSYDWRTCSHIRWRHCYFISRYLSACDLSPR